MEYEQILYQVEDSLLTITLNRPEKLNAFTTRMMYELLDAFERADADDAVRADVVTGAGRAFCAGADISSGGAAFDYTGGQKQHAIEEHRDGGGLVALRIFESRKPVIAAINGPAVGVGITMTLPMDVRIASSAARMGFVFTRRGIVPEACSSWFLPRLVGIGRAAEWVLTGRVFPVEEALAGGLVSRVTPPEGLLETARGLGREIADHTSAMSVALARQRFLGREDAAGEHPLRGAADADHARQEPAAARLGDDAAAGEDEAHARAARRDADVHRQRHRDADAHRGPVDRGDDRLPRLEDTQRDQAAAVAVLLGRLCLGPARVVEGAAAAAQVRAGAEGAPGPGHDDGAHRVVGVGARKGVEQLVHHARSEGVQPLGTVERDGEHARLDAIEDLLVVHYAPSTGRSSKSRYSPAPPSSSATM